MKKTLIVVDMQNDFIDMALGTKEALSIVPKVKEKIEEYVKKNYHHELSNDEKLYLMVHIERTVYKTDK